jgi:hypothetical protein
MERETGCQLWPLLLKTMLSKPSPATTAQTQSVVENGSHDKMSKPRGNGSKGFSDDNRVTL